MIVINDYLNSEYLIEGLDLLSLAAVLFGVIIIINKNPISSLMCLIGLFGCMAIYLIMIGLSFIGFSYLIVYIGAVSILFLFILMLINIRTSELTSNNSNSIPLALFISIILNFTLFHILPYYIAITNSYNNKLNTLVYYLPEIKYFHVFELLSKKKSIDTSNIMYVTSNNWDSNITETSHIAAIGNILYTTYNMWLFIASFILLLAMVGAILVTMRTENVRKN